MFAKLLYFLWCFGLFRLSLLLERPESFQTGQDLYGNLSNSQIRYLTRQHENKAKKLNNRDVKEFEIWKNWTWQNYYRNVNFIFSMECSIEFEKISQKRNSQSEFQFFCFLNYVENNIHKQYELK